MQCRLYERRAEKNAVGRMSAGGVYIADMVIIILLPVYLLFQRIGDYQMIKFTTPYIKWQSVKITIGIIAIPFFLSMAKNKNAKQGGMVSPKITGAFIMPI